MKASDQVFLLQVPRNQTALMQHLQLLVMRKYIWWCGGIIDSCKLEAFVKKMATRYPVTRTTRGRTYDRLRGLATVHLVVFPVDEGRISWWLLSDAGRGGLSDQKSPDAHIAKNAASGTGHIFFSDYVLLYAHKKDARTVADAITGKEKKIIKDMSTWTWKMTDAVLNETKRDLEATIARLDYGREGEGGISPSGVLGILACQRSRPLFSGVRNQVIGLHRHADTLWGRVQKQWQSGRSKATVDGSPHAGELRSVQEVMACHLPKMTRIAIHASPPKTIATLVAKDG